MTDSLLPPLLTQATPAALRAVACACAERAVRGCPIDPSAASLIEALAVARGSLAACMVAWQAVLRHPWGRDEQGAARRWAWRAVWWATFPRPDYTAHAARSALWMARHALATEAGPVGSDSFTAVLTTEAQWQLAEARRYAATPPSISRLSESEGHR